MQNFSMKNSILRQTASRAGKPIGFLLIMSALLCVLSPTNLEAQAKGTLTIHAPSVEILTSTGGVDFRGYVAELRGKVTRKWFAVMPEAAQLGNKGKVVVRFQIQKDGTQLAKEPTIEFSSDSVPLDKAALSAVRSSAPFHHLPEALDGRYIELRLTFLYNLPPESSGSPDTRSH